MPLNALIILMHYFRTWDCRTPELNDNPAFRFLGILLGILLGIFPAVFLGIVTSFSLLPSELQRKQQAY